MRTASRDGASRSVTILGATGSVGRNTVELIAADPDRYRVKALTANGNATLLAAQARRLGAEMAVLADPARYRDLADALSGTGIRAAAGPEALIEAASLPASWVMAAIVGAAGLAPTLAAVRRGAVVALANKECLVSAGSLLMHEVARAGATLLPVDSEHSAIFQVFDFERPESVERIILTASGGPFRELSRGDMKTVTPDQACAHPNWSMGAKISVDSATLMNKGLELIEASYLFPVAPARIEVIIHPQSVVHSLVAYIDGSVLAQLGTPDMRTPIAVALGWPARIATPAPRLDLAQLATLTFEQPDIERFPALALARHALKKGGRAPTILNAANEVAVQGFLDGRLAFLEIADIVADVLESVEAARLDTLADVFEADATARAATAARLGRVRNKGRKVS